MKRIMLLASLLMIVGTSALAFDPTPVRGNRIGILNTEFNDRDDLVTLRVASLMRGYLARELKKQGFDVFHARSTMDDLLDGAESDADYFVEFVYGDGHDRGHGGVGIGGRNVGVDMAVITSYIAAGLRVYDGRTLEVIDEFDVHARDTALRPTFVSLGGRHTGFSGLWLGIPLEM